MTNIRYGYRVVTPYTWQCFLSAAANVGDFGPFFLKILNFVYVKKVCQKSRPFSKCIRPQNSLLLSGVVTFPDFSKIEGQRLCL